MLSTRAKLLAFLCLLYIGCNRQEKIYPEKSPLPVSVILLSEQQPKTSRTYAGSVRSWKTENIAFEVSGRVKWVVEPGTEIEGRTYDPDGNVLSSGTQIAQLDDERFVSAVEAAKSQEEIAILQRDSVQVQIDSVLPAEIAAAKSDLELAQSEFARNKRLVAQGAGSRKSLEQAKSSAEAAQSKLDGLNAKLKQTRAELKSADASIAAASQALKDAKRDLADTKLYSAFRGIVADVFVVPGSLSNSSSEVATIQMMNPIKVEMEISSEMSRTIQVSDTIPLRLKTPDNKQETVQSTAYAIAPSADNATRTFKLTLLVGNRKVEAPLPVELRDKTFARAKSLWRVDLDILPETEDGIWYMPANGIYEDDRGSFVWKVADLKIGEPVRRVLTLKKLYVNPGDVSIPFLGKMRFRTVEIAPGQEFDPKADFFVGEVRIAGGDTKTWAGGKMLLDAGDRWLLRPGDVVDVDLTPQSQAAGIYVPIEAIHEDAGETFVFTVESSDNQTVARRVKIDVIAEDSGHATSLQRIQSLDGKPLAGSLVVTEGVHYLADGEAVNIVSGGTK